jgi:hypothetical protein
MKYQILAIIHVKSDFPKLLEFGMEHTDLNDSIEAMKICDSEGDAHKFLIEKAKLYNERHFGNETDLKLMLNEIEMGCLTLNGVTAYISEVEECYIIRVKESGTEIQHYDNIEDARIGLSTFEDIDIIEGNYTENYYEIFDTLTNKIVE